MKPHLDMVKWGPGHFPIYFAEMGFAVYGGQPLFAFG